MTDVVSWRKTLPFIRDNRLSNRFNLLHLECSEPYIILCLKRSSCLEGNASLECLDTNSGGMNPAYLQFFNVSNRMWHSNAGFLLLSHSMGDAIIDQVVSLIQKKNNIQRFWTTMSLHDKTEVGYREIEQAERRYLMKCGIHYRLALSS
jgi:hypothetical protein